MASVIKAGNATDGVQVTSDNTGILELKTGTGSGTTAVTVDASQNAGLGVTPSAWGSTFKALELNGGSLSSGASTNLVMMQNAYYDGVNYIYKTTSTASRYWQVGGAHAFFTAPSGTAGNAITFTQAMTLDASGNLGLGVTPSAWQTSTVAFEVGSGTALWNPNSSNQTYLLTNASYSSSSFKYKSTATAAGYRMVGNSHEWLIAPSGTAGNAITFTQAMTLDASGNLGLGTSSPTNFGAGFTVGQINGSSGGYLLVSQAGTTSIGEFGTESGLVYVGSRSTNTPIVFRQNGTTERARFTSGGFFKVSTTGAYVNSAVYHEFTNSSSDWVVWNRNTSASPSGLRVNYSGAAPNGTVNEFLLCNDTSATRAAIRSNGGLANFSANNVNLSDRREKTNFAPAKNYLDVICAIPVQTFNYIDQNVEDDPGLTLGVVAQDVQSVAPEMVMESNWGTEEEPKMRLSIYQTDLQYALMKCIQELKAELDATKAEVAALKGAAQ